MPDISTCGLYLDCTNDQMSAEQLFRILVKADTNGCPAINVVTQGAGGGEIPAGIATETTLQAVLTALNQQQDFEPKLIIDQGNGDQVACQIIEFDEQTVTYNYIYKDVNGNPYVPVGPIKYINPEALLSLIQTELVALNAKDFATETTLAAIEAHFEPDVDITKVTISGAASTVVPGSTYYSVQLIVKSGSVTEGGIVYGPGVYTDTAPLKGTIATAYNFDASAAGTEAYLKLMTNI